MEKMKKWLKRALLCLVAVVGVYSVSSRVAFGAWPDPEADLGALRMLASGAVAWRVQVTSNALEFVDNVTTGLRQFRVFPGNGGTAVVSRTSTQIAQDVPGAAGALSFDSTLNMLCVSTGTGPGAWVGVSSFTSATSQVRVVCN